MGYSCPALEAVRIPFERSSMPNQTVTNIFSLLFSQIRRFTFSMTSRGLRPDMAWVWIMFLAIIMNMAAGMPLPETSAMTRARWSSSTKKKS